MPRQRAVQGLPGLVPGNRGPDDDPEKLRAPAHQNGIAEAQTGPGLSLVAGNRAGRFRVGPGPARKGDSGVARSSAAGPRRRDFRLSTSRLPRIPTAELKAPRPVEDVGTNHPNLLPKGDWLEKVRDWRKVLMTVASHDPAIMTGHCPVAHSKGYAEQARQDLGVVFVGEVRGKN